MGQDRIKINFKSYTLKFSLVFTLEPVLNWYHELSDWIKDLRTRIGLCTLTGARLGIKLMFRSEIEEF